jgi:hypothetical protein
MNATSEPKDVNPGAPTPAHSRQSGPDPADEKNLGRIIAYLMAEFGGQHWARDLRRVGRTIYLSTTGPRGRHFVGITAGFLDRYRSRDVVAVVAGRGLATRLRRAKGTRRILVTKTGLPTARLDDADAPPKRTPRARGRSRGSSSTMSPWLGAR